jgi:hypothetical protein
VTRQVLLKVGDLTVVSVRHTERMPHAYTYEVVQDGVTVATFGNYRELEQFVISQRRPRGPEPDAPG